MSDFAPTSESFPPPSLDPFAGLLLSGYPRESEQEGKKGNTYCYEGPYGFLKGAKPEAGDVWSDGIPVSSVYLTVVEDTDHNRTDTNPLKRGRLEVITARVLAAFTIGTVRERITYGLSWVEVDEPLETHPKFDGGDWNLTDTDLKYIWGWQKEVDFELKASAKFKLKDSDGNAISGVISVPPASNAYKFITLLKKGFDSWANYLPVWKKVSIYKGTLPPEISYIGQKNDPTGPVPSAIMEKFEFRKADDTLDNLGVSNRWQRTEAWQGARKVYIDIDEIFLGDPE